MGERPRVEQSAPAGRHASESGPAQGTEPGVSNSRDPKLEPPTPDGPGAAEPPPPLSKAPLSREEEYAGLDRPNAYRVQLPEFEGPLDLLLHLIQKHELNILDIPIGFIAQKYVEYIRMMEQLSIDLASEYLVMAATLAYIKSRMLLPADPNAVEDDDLTEDELDPRAELIRRLLEYQKYKLAAADLGERSVLGRDVFARGPASEASTDPLPLAPISLFKLVDAFESVLQRSKLTEEHQIDFERISVTEKIGQISDLLRETPRLRFEELFSRDSSRAEMIVTFLALLEMTKLRMTNLTQETELGPIFVELAVSDDEPEPEDDALARDSWDSSTEDPDEDVLAPALVPDQAVTEEQNDGSEEES
jgi:segregation and condensation protein A